MTKLQQIATRLTDRELDLSIFHFARLSATVTDGARARRAEATLRVLLAEQAVR